MTLCILDFPIPLTFLSPFRIDSSAYASTTSPMRGDLGGNLLNNHLLYGDSRIVLSYWSASV